MPTRNEYILILWSNSYAEPHGPYPDGAGLARDLRTLAQMTRHDDTIVTFSVDAGGVITRAEVYNPDGAEEAEEEAEEEEQDGDEEGTQG